MAGLSRAVVDAAEGQGVDLSELLRRHGVDRETLDRADAWVPVELHEAIWEAAAEGTGRSDAGLWMSSRYTPGLTGVVEYILRSCSTVRDAADTWCRLASLVSPCIESELVTDGAEIRLVWRLHRPETLATRSWAEFALGRTVRLLREAVDDPTLAPRRVELKHQAPIDVPVARYEAFFGCPVRFGCEDHATLWSTDVGGRRLKGVDPLMRAALEARAVELSHDGDSFRSDALHAVRALLFSSPNRVTLAAVAHRHSLSPRSFQRRLEQEGLSLRGLVDDVRRTEYERLRGALTQAALADRLGFADAAALRKACKRWEAQRGTNLRKTRPESDPI